MELTLRHSIEYGVTDDVAIDDIVKSLQANARLLRDATDVISGLIPGLEIEPIRISIPELHQGSPLREVFALTIFLAFQDDLERDVPDLVQMLTGVEISEQYDSLITVLVMVIAVYGISKAWDILFPGRDKTPVTQSEASLLARAAKMLGVTVDALRMKIALLFAGRRNRGILTASQQVFAPTRGQSAEIREPGGRTLVTREAVSMAQSAAGLPADLEEEDKPRTSTEFHRSVRIVLHAQDRDHKRSGWAGHVPDLFDERVAMDLVKTLSPQSLFGKTQIRGDILLKREEDDKGDMQPKEILLLDAYID